MGQQSVFLKIIFIYFLLMCKVLNTKICLFKLAAILMFHLKTFFILSLLFICSLLLLSGDIESNPGPRNNKNLLPSVYNWNLNSLPTHDFSQMLLLKALIILYISTILYVRLKLIFNPRYRQITFR